MIAACGIVLDTTSDTNKNRPTTALSRSYSNQGLKQASFKAQKMSNNRLVLKGMLARYAGSDKCVLLGRPPSSGQVASTNWLCRITRSAILVVPLPST